MPTFTFTEKELEVVRHAMSMINDIEEDSVLENVSEDLFPRPDAPIVLTYEKAKEIRCDLEVAMDRRMYRHSAMRKLGVTINPDTGYSG